jgi:uncharacterized membrane protein
LQALKAGDVLAMLGLAASTFLLIVKAIQPTTLQITIDGQSIQTQQIPIIYTPADIAVIAASAFIMGVSLHHILTSIALKPAQPPTPSAPGPEQWQRTLKGLTDPDEKALYQLIIENTGTMFQGELVDRSGFTKSKVSLVLDRLEARRKVERKRYGMSNIVQLK